MEMIEKLEAWRRSEHYEQLSDEHPYATPRNCQTGATKWFKSMKWRSLRARNAWVPQFRGKQYKKLDDVEDSPESTSRRSSWKTMIESSTWPTFSKMLKAGCYLPITSLLLEVVIIVLFLTLYLRLPDDPAIGDRERIASQYSAWPFISCVGSTTPIVYQSLSILTAVFFLSSAGRSFYYTRHHLVGYWLRRAQLVETSIGTALLIWLVFASDDVDSHLHIALVALRLLFLFATKLTAWTVWFLMRRSYYDLGADRLWMISFSWKTVMLVPGVVAATLANVGAFSCKDSKQIQKPGTTCYRLIFGAAVSD
ncbi:uncharacterized protein LTR77_004730 [Saxophila tyrrhenica]|uniref:Uncharacterized protein n=1 Tax=Saxophila tyrrhenica TaxID=1690608 RepID=A0AAV9PE19_9PEZI|nr:hypothetical protein LTR77_004730 [Saxophila tyrrhenica]